MARPKAFDRDKAKTQALQLFWRKGYTATSIEDLVEALGLSRSSLYDTFGDKRSLFLEALQSYSDRVIAGIERTLRESPTPLDGLRAIFDELAAGAGGPAGAMGCFMVNSIAELVPYDPDVTRIAAAYNETLQQMLAGALAQDGVTREQTPEQLAAYVFNAIQGLKVLIKSGATRGQVQAISAITLNSLR